MNTDGTRILEICVAPVRENPCSSVAKIHRVSYRFTRQTTKLSNKPSAKLRTQPMDESELHAELERHHAASFGWALSCVRDASEADEVLQNVYLKILDGRARFHGASSFRTWLFAVIRRTAADEWRKNFVRQIFLLRFEKENGSSERMRSPDESLDRSQLQSLFREGLANLPRRQREAISLVFYHDLTIAEAAEVMGVSLGSARTHYDRAKKQLRNWIEQKGLTHELRRNPTEAVVL